MFNDSSLPVSQHTSGEALDESPGVEARPLYFIDLDWYKANSRSFSVLARSRMCPACQQLGRDGDPFIVIRECCSGSRDFYSLDLPIAETLFRIFLAAGNQPLDLDEVYERLKQTLASLGSNCYLSLQGLQRLLDNDRYYGIRRFEAQPLGKDLDLAEDKAVGYHSPILPWKDQGEPITPA